MNVTITNISPDTLKAIEILLKPFIEKNKMQIIKSNSTVDKAIIEAETMLKSGNYKTYNNLEEYKKALNV